MLPFLMPAPILSAAVIDVTLSNAAQITLSSYFSAADWAGPKLKRVLIPAGVTIGSSSQAVPALNCGTGRGGLLEIVLDGNIDGAGGITNGQNGGDALYAPQAGVTLKGGGNSRPGGGAGGDGGDGGAGVYYTGRTVTEGPFFNNGSAPYYLWADGVTGGIWWAQGGDGVNPTFHHSGLSPYSPGDGWTYYPGSFVGAGGGGLGNEYYVSRQTTIFDVPNATSGGAKGTHGRGQGYDGAATSGTAGSAGGTNAGTGGAGGAGGAFGDSGTAGTNGAAGNNGAGVGASGAGLAGFGLNGNANVTRTAFTGSILGRIG
jgi:hypothetical protein